MTKAEAVPLGSVATITRKTIAPERIQVGTAYVGLENIQRGGAIQGVQHIGPGDVGSTKFEFNDQQVLFGKLRPNLAKIARPEFDGVCSTDILAISPGPLLDKAYLAHYLSHPDIVALSTARAAGVNLPRLSPTELAKFELPLPPLEEQRRIAGILDRVDGLRAQRRESLVHLEDLNQSIFLDMFGTALNILQRWPTKPLGALLSFLTSGSRGWARHYAEEGALFLRIQNVGHDHLVLDDIAYVIPPDTAEARRTLVEAGDVLLSITADLGRTAVVPAGLGQAFINQHLSLLRAPSIVPVYLSAFLSSPAGQRQVLGRNRQGVKAGLNFDDVRSIVVAIPPIELQWEFAERRSCVERQTGAHRSHLAELDELFNSVQARAFTASFEMIALGRLGGAGR